MNYLLGALPMVMLFIVVGVAWMRSPYTSRTTILFGYTIPADFEDSIEGQAIVRSFQRRMLAVTAL